VCFLVAMSGELSVVDIYINAGYPLQTETPGIKALEGKLLTQVALRRWCLCI